MTAENLLPQNPSGQMRRPEVDPLQKAIRMIDAATDCTWT